MNKFKVSCKEELAEIIREGTPQLYNVDGLAITYDDVIMCRFGGSPYRVGNSAMADTWKSLDVYTKPDLLAEATWDNLALAWVCDDEKLIGKEKHAVRVYPDKINGLFLYKSIDRFRWKYARLVVNDDLAKGKGG